MNNILYKDLKLSIPRFFYIMPFLTGALFLIPQWPYFLALMYFFFISVPNILSTFNAQNDLGFSVMMPISKEEIVKGKILTFITLELLHIVTGAFFAFIHVKIFGPDNFFFDINLAFFGIAFIMFGIFNFILFIMYFKSAYFFGFPVIMANAAVLIFITLVEFLNFLNKPSAALFEGVTAKAQWGQFGILLFGMFIFIILNVLSLQISQKRFNNVDL